jgi:hypothetical protein
MNIPSILEIKVTSFPSAESLAGCIVGTASPAVPPETSALNSDTKLELSKALIAIAGQSWRLKTAITDPETGDTKNELSSQELRKVANALEAISQTLQELGIRVIDRCNEDFHPGLPDQVITEEPREGISKERIIRTIRPTIIWHQMMVQRGEIDIAVPAPKNIPSDLQP